MMNDKIANWMQIFRCCFLFVSIAEYIRKSEIGIVRVCFQHRCTLHRVVVSMAKLDLFRRFNLVLYRWEPSMVMVSLHYVAV